MAIYYLYINGKYKFSTNSFEELITAINIAFSENAPHIDFIISDLIINHEYHFYDTNSLRKFDIAVNTFGK